MYSTGSLTVRNHSLFQNNQALGGAGGQGENGTVGTAAVGGSNDNGSNGGDGVVGGLAQGGAIFYSFSATLPVTNSTFLTNTAKSGVGGRGGNGGVGGAGDGTGNGGGGANGGTGGNGSSAWGGGIAAIGSNGGVDPGMTVSGSTFSGNQAIADSPGSGGNGGNGGNGGTQGSGGNGGSGGTGGIIPSQGSNSAITSVGSWGGAIGMEYGNGLTVNSSAFASNFAILNSASNGGAGAGVATPEQRARGLAVMAAMAVGRSGQALGMAMKVGLPRRGEVPFLWVIPGTSGLGRRLAARSPATRSWAVPVAMAGLAVRVGLGTRLAWAAGAAAPAASAASPFPVGVGPSVCSTPTVLPAT